MHSPFLFSSAIPPYFTVILRLPPAKSKLFRPIKFDKKRRLLLFTHVCPATGFCRCYAFQIGKICCRNCIVRNFQFRKFLPVNSYPLSFIPSARQNVNEIFLIKITPFLYSKKRRHCKQVRRFLPNIGCWLSTDTEKIPAENLGQFVTECNASRNFE